MRNNIIKIILFLFFTTAVYADNSNDVFSISVSESYFSNPEDVIPLLTKTLNDNNVMKFISYFPLKQDMKTIGFTDFANYIKCINANNTQYFPGFENILLIRVIDDHVKRYNEIKVFIFKYFIPELKTIISIKGKNEAEKYRKKMIAILKKPINIEIQERFTFNRDSLYKYTDAYLYRCNLKIENKVISKNLLIRVEKIDNQWRVTSSSVDDIY